MEIIRALVEAGADVQKPNHFGGTCLINSVQSPELVEFLIQSGVDVNAEDVQHKTALHYAVQEHRLETTKVLLTNGADPYKRSKYGDDILQTACLKGALMIFNYIIETVKYDSERLANSFELLGSTFLLDLHDMASTLFFWNKALEIRNEETGGDCSKSFLTTHPVLGVQEFSTKAQLEIYSFDSSLMKLQGLLITERILGQQHKDTIFRYMYSGAAHADSNEYHPCIMLWNYALKLKINKETLLACDTSFTIRAVVQLFLNILIREEVQDDLEFTDVLNTTKYINAGLQHSVNLLNILPQFKTHKENLDLVLQSWLHLVYLLLRLAQDNDDRREIYHIVKTVRDIAPVSSTGDSVLHMAVSSSSAVRSNSFLDDDSISLFPSLDVIKFLVNCGISTQLRNNDRETPLHIAAMKAGKILEYISVFIYFSSFLALILLKRFHSRIFLHLGKLQGRSSSVSPRKWQSLRLKRLHGSESFKHLTNPPMQAECDEICESAVPGLLCHKEIQTADSPRTSSSRMYTVLQSTFMMLDTSLDIKINTSN